MKRAHLTLSGLVTLLACSVPAHAESTQLSFEWSDSVSTRVGGEARLRWELWENFGFDAAQDDHFPLLRLRLHADSQFGDHLRLFIEGKSAWAGDRDLPGGRRPLDEDRLDVQNAYVDIRAESTNTAWIMRLGRQELLFGAQRLVSPLDWANTRRTFDGARVLLNHSPWAVSLFATQPVIVEPQRFNEPNADQRFYGVYATRKKTDANLTHDMYLLRLDMDRETGDEERYTAGTRLAGICPITGADFDVEGGYQFGDQGTRDIAAWFLAAQLGYTRNEWPGSPRVYVGYDYASGGRDDGGKSRTFNQLFPLGHAYLGYIDLLGRQNIEAYSLGYIAKPAQGWQVRLDGHYFQRADRADAAYNVGGGVLRAADTEASRELGSEIDLTVSWKMNPATVFSGGYSFFVAGDFFKETGPSKDMHFAYTAAQWTF